MSDFAVNPQLTRPNKEFTAGVRTERTAIRALIARRMIVATPFSKSVYQGLLNDIKEHVALTQVRKGEKGRW
jgi:hypothetical protein